MSPTPPVHKSRLIIAGVIALAMILGLFWWRATSVVRPQGQPQAQVEPVLPTPARPTSPPPMDPRTLIISADLARAVAAVGEFDDGRRPSLHDLPDTVRSLSDQARLLLASRPRQVAPGLPMRFPDGAEMGMTPDPVRPGNVAPIGEIPAGSPTERELARAVDGRLVARSFTIAGKLPMPIRGDRIKEILEPDAWIAVPYNPALVAGEPLEITNRSLGQYVLRLDAEDYGSVRLNGGLVVPGRFYLMDGTMTISGDVPVGVTIRPLGVVHSYYDQPLRPPSANG